jgi:hypothetical protein
MFSTHVLRSPTLSYIFQHKESKNVVLIASYFCLLEDVIKPISSDQRIQPVRGTATPTIGTASVSNQPSEHIPILARRARIQ